MKNVSFLLALLPLCFYSCDPPNKAIFNTESVKLIGSISDTNEVIHLGDSLKFSIQIPDTINSSSGSLVVQSLGYSIFIMRILKIDTVNNIALLPNVTTITITKGSYASSLGNYVFNNIQKPYRFDLIFKPEEKGIYYFEVAAQPGTLRINNGYEARLYVGFNIFDTHPKLAAPYFGDIQAFLNAVEEKKKDGRGFYAFRVN